MACELQQLISKYSCDDMFEKPLDKPNQITVTQSTGAVEYSNCI